MISKVLFLTLMFIWNVHGEMNKMARIVGGIDAKPSKWKFVVAVYKLE